MGEMTAFEQAVGEAFRELRMRLRDTPSHAPWDYEHMSAVDIVSAQLERLEAALLELAEKLEAE
jgi:hypothetical protein